MKGDKNKFQYRINEQIRVREVRIVGEDIEAGTYLLSVEDGWGTIRIYKDYNTFAQDNGSILDSMTDYYVSAPGHKYDYPSEIGSLKLVDGMCLSMEGFTGSMERLR